MNLLVHPRTNLQIESFISSPSHAVILHGANGIGKGSVTKHLAQELLGVKDFTSYPYSRLIEPKDGKAIGIEEVRSLDEFLSLKVPSKEVINRIIIIGDSDHLTIEAQNALLKTLEEPPKGTVIILTASYAEGLLPTIRSRAQTITIQVPALSESREYFLKSNQARDVEQALAIAGGLPGLMHSMLEDEDHPLLIAVEQAKSYLRASQYERLIQSDALAKDRKLTEQTLYIIQQMAHISLQSAQDKAAKRWQIILESTYEASKALNQNGQAKLVLANLALSF